MDQRDALAATGSAVTTLGLLIAFDLVTGSEIAWVFNVVVAGAIGLVVGYSRTAA